MKEVPLLLPNPGFLGVPVNILVLQNLSSGIRSIYRLLSQRNWPILPYHLLFLHIQIVIKRACHVHLNVQTVLK
jgi:uncharacterized membrane protein